FDVVDLPGDLLDLTDHPRIGGLPGHAVVAGRAAGDSPRAVRVRKLGGLLDADLLSGELLASAAERVGGVGLFHAGEPVGAELDGLLQLRPVDLGLVDATELAVRLHGPGHGDLVAGLDRLDRPGLPHDLVPVGVAHGDD